MNDENRSRTSDRTDRATAAFGLTAPQLHPIIEGIAGEPVAGFDVRIEHDVAGHGGYGGKKVIATFTYATRSRREGTAVVFVKELPRNNQSEVHNYRRLAELNAPIPQFYGTLQGADGAELMFLEYVEPVGECMPFERFLGDASRLLQFFAAIARLNAVRPGPEYAAELSRPDLFCSGLKRAAGTLDDLWGRACKGELGDGLERLCRCHCDELPRLKTLTTELIEPVASMEIGLCHNDLAPDGVGWRLDTGEALILDLETIGFAPRFRDIADWCGAPDGVHPLCRSPEALAEHYLEHYARWGGAAPSTRQLLSEARTLWIAQTFDMLWFSVHRALDGKVDFTEDREEGRTAYRVRLGRTIRGLIEAAAVRERHRCS